jgi:hypothetical protein
MPPINNSMPRPHHVTARTTVRPLLVSVLILFLAGIGAFTPFVARIRAQAVAVGGFIETDLGGVTRPALTPTQIATFMPALRGPFTFPAPYLTQGIRLTDSTDCPNATDCVQPTGYAYWRNINNHVGSDTMYIFMTLLRTQGGVGPSLFSYNKVTGAVANVGPLFSPSDPYSWATGEGWYFSATQPTALYINEPGGNRFYRYDVLAKTSSLVFDATTHFGSGTYIWQLHSSNNDLVHSFTLRSQSDYSMMGCGAYKEDTQQWFYYAARGDFDECQIDASGRYLLIKENVDGLYGEDNVVEDLQAGTESVLLDQNGAAGHSDMGFGYMVAEDNFFSQPGAVRVWSFDKPFTDTSQGKLVFETNSWDFGSSHISHTNAVSTLPSTSQYVCTSEVSRLTLLHGNEVVCYMLDGSLNVMPIAPVMTNLDASGGGTDDYWKLPKGNLDVTGQYFIWTTNLGGPRIDAMIVHVPSQVLTGVAPPSSGSGSGSGSGPGAGAGTPPPPTVPSGVSWMNTVNVAAVPGSLTKNGGCDGCQDAGAASTVQVLSGDCSLAFRASETSTNRAIGLTGAMTGSGLLGLNYGLQLSSGHIEVRERGVYKSEATFLPGDQFTISVTGKQVRYAKNGTVFYTSTTKPSYPLIGKATLLSLNSTITGVTLTGAKLTGR